MFELGSQQVARSGVTTTQYIIGSNNNVQLDLKGHTHFYDVDASGNGVAYPAYHPDREEVYHEHQIVNWKVLEAESNCYPNCEDLYDVDGVSLHSHYLETRTIDYSDYGTPESGYGVEHPNGTHWVVQDTVLYSMPTVDNRSSAIGTLPAGVSVRVMREMVNGSFSNVKVIPGSATDQLTNNRIQAFANAAVQELNFYTLSNALAPYPKIRPKILQKVYVSPEHMTSLERTLVPNWVDLKTPYYHRGKAEYWSTGRVIYSCDVPKGVMIEEAKLKAIAQLFRYYNVFYDQTVALKDSEVGQFASGFLSNFIHDYHLGPRPGDKFKVLVKVRAIYFNWLRQNGAQIRSTDPQQLPKVYKKITLDPARYKRDFAKISQLLSKFDYDMRRQGVELPGRNFTKESLRVQNFTQQLDRFLLENNMNIDGDGRTDYTIEIGFDEDMQVVYVVAKHAPPLHLRAAQTYYN